MEGQTTPIAQSKTVLGRKNLPTVTLLLPAYNEADIILQSLDRLCKYMQTLEDRYTWDILMVNDGSKDNTGILADQFALTHPNIRVIHHSVNRNLGAAIRTGFRTATGKYIVVLDMDLSYSPDHIGNLLDQIHATGAEIVVASPYMKKGKTTNVPWKRLLMSKMINRLMRITSGIEVHTFTGMARAYKREIIEVLNLKSNSYSINPEIIHKADILGARIIEIPAHLDWTYQKTIGKNRTSSLRVYKGILQGLMSSFILRPYGFFMAIGMVILVMSIYVISWIFYHVYMVYPDIQVASGQINDQFTEAVRLVYENKPHAFLIGGFTFVIAIQFLGLGFISLQKKRYFDELFHINTSLMKKEKDAIR